MVSEIDPVAVLLRFSTQNYRHVRRKFLTENCVFASRPQWIVFSDIFQLLSRSSHFTTPHDAEHANLTIRNTAERLRNDFNGLNAHVLVQLFFCTLNIYQ